MANTYSALYYHVVFSTKDRRLWIKPEFEEMVWRVLSEIAAEHEMKALCIGGVEDHVHAVLAVPPSLAVSKAVQFLKGGSSKRIHAEVEGWGLFAWQDGYSAFTVSHSQLEAVVGYVRNQRTHHEKIGHSDELHALLKKHRVAFEEKYLS